MKALFVTLGTLTLVTLLAVHVAAVFDVNLFDHAPWLVIVLIPGIFIPFAAFVVQIPGALDLGKKPVGGWTWSHTSVSFTRLLGLFPVWARWVIAGAYGYAGILAVYMAFLGNGQAAIRDGRFVLADKSHVVRELTRAEYQHLHARDALVTCGFVTVFCILPLLYFLVGGPEGWKRQPPLGMKRHN